MPMHPQIENFDGSNGAKPAYAARPSYDCTHMHTFTATHMHTRACTHERARAHACTHARMHACTRTYACTRTHACVRTHAHACTCIGVPAANTHAEGQSHAKSALLQLTCVHLRTDSRA